MTEVQPSPLLQTLRAAREQREVLDEAQECETSLVSFIRYAWPVLKPMETYHHNWHIEVIAEKLEAVSRGEIKRLQIWIPPGTMKPVDVDALVLMGDGSRKRLGDIEAGDYVISHIGRPCLVSAVHEQGLLPTLTITTESRRTVSAAPDHPFLTPEGWKRADELKLGEALGTVVRPVTAGSTDRSLEEFRLAGYFVGDGNVTISKKKPGTMASNITCVDPVQAEDIIECVEALGFRAHASAALTRARRYDISGGVRTWLRETGLAGGSSWTKRVPEWVFTAPDEHVSHFIGAYFSCDGTLGHVRAERSTASVIFNSVNRPLLEDIQHLLLRFGVKSRLRKHISRQNNFVGGDHKSWRLVITSTDDTSKFIASIPVIGAKAQKLQEIGVLRTRFDEMIQPDKILEIADGGLKECRCLTVEDDHSFTANDLIVKNTLIVSVFWPAWEWTTNPWRRYWGASYEVRFAGRIAATSRDLILSSWYQQRWGDKVKLTRDAENYFANTVGGTRLATAPNSTGSGEHGHRILIDDPINAKAADATSGVVLKEVNDWYDGTVVTRGIGNDHARVIVMQRLHEEDLAAHVLKMEEWEVLCLPERYEPKHPFVSPEDLRQEEGELLWASHRNESLSNALAASLTPHRAAGQLQQRPAAKEGDLLKSTYWRFYDPRIRAKEKWEQLPKFSMVLMSIDSPQKDKETNDNVAIQTWGIAGVQRYLVDFRLDKMSYPSAKRAVTEMAEWARRTWPRARHKILVENTGYGSELILDLKKLFTGVTKINPQQDGDKVVRADAASDALESGHCFLPGYGPPWHPPVWEASETPADVNALIQNFARFPNATHDDDIDAWSQMINWLRGRASQPARTGSVSQRRRARAAA